MAPIDYCVELAEGRIAPPANLDIATIQQQELANDASASRSRNTCRAAPPTGGRAASPKRSTDFAALNARSKFWGDDGRAAFRNWEEVADPRNPLGGRQGVDERIMLRELLRRLDMMVHAGEPARRAGAPAHAVAAGARSAAPTIRWAARSNLRLETFYGPNAGLTEVLIPAGYVTTV